MKKKAFVVWMLLCTGRILYAQDAPNLSNASMQTPNTQAAGKLSSVPVNIFTGVPSVSVPIYSYSNNGISFGISLGYSAGGAQINESPSSVGLNWNLNAGGVITRTVRGMPDDIATNGYLYAPAIPTDFRSNGDKYYFDTLDTQQDVFQFNFNGRSGKFFIGKNGQVAVIPQSKIKIEYTTDPTWSFISSFKITTEDGVKYFFSDCENTSVSATLGNGSDFRSGYAHMQYKTAWNLTQIISAFYTDTIKISYQSTHINSVYAYPQVGYFRVSDGAKTSSYAPVGNTSSDTKKIYLVTFPNKVKVSFVYGPQTYSGNDAALTKINIGDTLFRFGFLLGYQTSAAGDSRLLLKTVTPYTSKELSRGYTFSYNGFTDLDYSSNGTSPDRHAILMNAKDHWGFYNGKNNGTNILPAINGGSGADRSTDITYAKTNVLTSLNVPGGGYINYEYELNDHLPFTKSSQQVTVNSTYNTTNNISITDVFSNQRQINIALDAAVSRTGSAPLSGAPYLTCTITDMSNVTITSYSFALLDLFYTGLRNWSFNIPNGSYKLVTSLSGGTVTSGSFPIIFNWENKAADNSTNATTAGGLRIKRITRKNVNDDPNNFSASYEEYKYVTEDGKSSGFLGDIPKYDYPYKETVINGTTVTTSYNVVTSEPISTLNYTQGSPVGYSRVEVISGTSTHNIGKTVYEFTNLQDVGSNFSTANFPYAPQDLSEWGLGLPEKVSVYDNTGRLVQKTTNQYSFSTTGFTTSDFKSLKLGCVYITYNGDPANQATSRTRVYLGQEYYPLTGRVTLTSKTDTIFHSNNSVSANTTSYTYSSTYYNVKKIITSYDRNRELSLETRLYYPYDYTLSGTIGKLRDSGITAAVISSENWITGDGNPRIVDATITSYQNVNGGTFPYRLYKFQSSQPIAENVIGVFDPADLVRNSTYFKQQSTLSVYDGRNNVVQVDNSITGQSASVIMDYAQQYPIAKISNAINADVAYTSFESDGSGNWTIGASGRNLSNHITGKAGYNIANGDITKSGLTSSQTYLITVWGKGTAAITVNGSSMGASIATQNNWKLYSKTVTGIMSVTISGTGFIDELRLHPATANMMTYTYEPLIGVTSQCNANNTIIYNEYDSLNRVKIIRDKDMNIIKRYDYSDTTMLVTTQTGTPTWVATGKVCENGTDGKFDSVYTDQNAYSPTYNQTQNTYKGYDYCTCATPGSHPQYKLVNGVCELGVRWNTTTAYVKVYSEDGQSYVWKWRCTYYYRWSDGTRSDANPNTSPFQEDYNEYHDAACLLGQDNS